MDRILGDREPPGLRLFKEEPGSVIPTHRCRMKASRSTTSMSRNV